MLQILDHVVYETMDDDMIESEKQELSQSEREKLLSNLLAPDSPLPTGPPLFKSTIFPKLTRRAIAMICQVLCYEHDRAVYGTIYGLFLSYVHWSQSPLQNLIIVSSYRNS
jgi:hypothetical protein